MGEFHIEYDENYHLRIYKDINTALWKDFECGIIPQEKINLEKFKHLSDNLNDEFDANKFATSYIKHLSDASFLYKESLELVESLYKDYTLLIVTNGLKDVQNKRIKKIYHSKIL